MFITKILILFFLLQTHLCFTQNHLTNGSFEDLLIDEIGLAEGDNLVQWEVLTGSPDLFDMLDNNTQPIARAVSGDIFLRLLNCEILYQELDVPLLPGVEYGLSFSYQSFYNLFSPPQVDEHLCTNLAILGSRENMEGALNSNECLSNLSTPFSTIEYFDAPAPGYWNQIFWCFTPTDTIYFFGLGTEMASDCEFGVLVDDIALHKVEAGVGLFADIFPDTLLLCEENTCIDIATLQSYSFFWDDGIIGAERQICETGDLQVSYDVGGCALDEQITTLSANTIHFFSAPFIEVCEGECIELNLDNTHQITWNDGQTSYSRTLCSGQYQVNSRILGCEISDQINIREKQCMDNHFYAPNVFSPNLDGINDHWQLLPSSDLQGDIKEVVLNIFDRWGNLVYQSHQNNWDGRHNGKEMPSDTYVFVCQYKLEGNTKIFTKRGSITLLR